MRRIQEIIALILDDHGGHRQDSRCAALCPTRSDVLGLFCGDRPLQFAGKSVSSIVRIETLFGIPAPMTIMSAGSLALCASTSKAQSEAVAPQYTRGVPLWFQRPPASRAPSPSFAGYFALQIR
jgi:hypothetical protein